MIREELQIIWKGINSSISLALSSLFPNLLRNLYQIKTPRVIKIATVEKFNI